MRSNWMNLNGTWQFEIDNGRSGEARGLQKEGAALNSRITVPFCPESRLSGIGHTDFMYGVWYKRQIMLPEITGTVLLHFGAVDYCCRAYINGELAGEHKGGYSSFSFDITKLLRPGDNELTVYAEDDTRDRLIPSGKQARTYHSQGCYYTRTTGIWQTVWLEFLPEQYLRNVKYRTNIYDGTVTVEAQLQGCSDLSCEVTYEGRSMGSYTCINACGNLVFTIALKEKHLWEPGAGRLYDIKLRFGRDTVSSYFGLREVRLDGYKFLINGKSVFQRLVLDQGFYPEGIYTAPSDAGLVRDIELSLAAGFNGARLHEKVFEERFLYHADRLGYIVWGEYPDWGLDQSYADNIYAILPEWVEVLQRDINHPAIVGWCPRNETWDRNGRKQFDPSIAMTYDITKAMDPTRPCIDTSGHFHVRTDIFDVHCYEQDPTVFRQEYDKLMTNGTLHDQMGNRQTYLGGPAFVSEYGGIRWSSEALCADKTGSWGYGKDVADLEDFYARFQGLTDALLDNDRMFGLCYTQLTDVEQEQNGLYTYDRKPKFDAKRLAAIMGRKAAIEND